MNCTRCLTTVSPTWTNIQKLDLNLMGVNETLIKLHCSNCRLCMCLSVAGNEWKKVDALLQKKKRKDGWKETEEDDLLNIYILNQIMYNEIERRLDDFHIDFDLPDKTDVVKILWNEGNAIGFYTLKLKGSIIFFTMESYGMTTLDTAYIRAKYRRKGYGLSILEDIVKSFPNEDIGISTPISFSMYHVASKFLKLHPSYKTKLWEVSGVGSEGNRKLIYFTLKNPVFHKSLN